MKWFSRARHRHTPLPVADLIEKISAEPKVFCTQPWRKSGFHVVGGGKCFHAKVAVPSSVDPQTGYITIRPDDGINRPPILYYDRKRGWHDGRD